MTRPAHRPTRRPSGEERAFFEDLVALRQWYSSRGADDGIAVSTLRHAIASANAEMRRIATRPRGAQLGADAI
jgi:hypothetical protein